VLRRLLLAVLFCLATWVMVDRTSVDPVDRAAASTTDVTASIGKTVATPPLDTHPPEAHWEALLPLGIGAGGASRSQQLLAQAADLPAVSSHVPWPAVRRSRTARLAAQFRPPHLLHTPLLI